MAKKVEIKNDKSPWKPEQMEVLCNALDDIARGKSSTLDRIAECIEISLIAQLEPPESQPTKPEIVHKIRELAQSVETTAGKLVKEWDQRRETVKSKIRLPSASPKPWSRQRRRHSNFPTASTRSLDASRSPAAPNQRSDENASLAEDGQGRSNSVEGRPEEENEDSNNVQADPLGLNRHHTKGPKGSTSRMTRDYAALQRELLDTWKYSGHNRRFSEMIHIDDAELVFDSILRHIQKGVAAFCGAQPLEELTANKLSPAIVELASNMVFAKDRNGVRDILKALFGGFPRLVEAWEVEDQLTYLDKLVKPALPGLARQYQNDLFEVFRSLRAPLVPSDPWRSSELNETSPEGGWLLARFRHQSTFQTSLEQAFLTTLNFRLHMATTDRSEEQYSVRYFDAGAEFDGDAMTVTSSQTTDQAQFLAGDSAVLVCLCPAILRTVVSPQTRHSVYVLKALVMMEGWDIDAETDGYPRDLPRAPM